MEIAFDNEKYLKIQKEKIEERIRMFDNKLYLEFGGKIFDDYNASRVLPGFSPDAKIKLLQEFKDDLEIIFCINAGIIQKNKVTAKPLCLYQYILYQERILPYEKRAHP